MEVKIDDVMSLLGIEASTAGKREVRTSCPFCGKKGTFAISIEKNLFKCWRASCSKQGTALDLYALIRTGNKFKELTPEEKRGVFKEVQEHLRLPDFQMTPQAPAPPVQNRLAKDEQLSKVYTTLLSCLTLSEKDKKELLERGLTEEMIDLNGYRSLVSEPSERKALGAKLVRQLFQKGITPDELAGVPGFFQKAGTWQLRILTGMLIPVRNFKGLVVGICVHDKTRPAKYLSLSTRDFPNGTAQTARIHVPLVSSEAIKHRQYKKSRTIIVTEGILKSDVAASLGGFLLENPIIGVPGVGQIKELPAVFSAFKVKKVLNAFDMDKVLKIGVWQASEKLEALSNKLGLEYNDLYWDNEGVEKKLKSAKEMSKKLKVSLKADALWTERYGRNGRQSVTQSVTYLRCCAEVLWEERSKIQKEFWDWFPETKGLDDELVTLQKKIQEEFFVG